MVLNLVGTATSSDSSTLLLRALTTLRVEVNAFPLKSLISSPIAEGFKSCSLARLTVQVNESPTETVTATCPSGDVSL